MQNIPMLHEKLDGVVNVVCDVDDVLLLISCCGGGDTDMPIVESTEPGSL